MFLCLQDFFFMGFEARILFSLNFDKGALVIQGEYIGMWGQVPKITYADVKYENITKA